MKEKITSEYLAWVEIDLAAISENIRAIKALAQSRRVEGALQNKKRNQSPEILAVIKADAYGHGMVAVANLLKKQKIGFLGVSDVREGLILRKNGFKEKILLLETPLPTQVKEVVEHNLIPTVCTKALAAALNNCAKASGRRVCVHIKVDTGMGRLGVAHHLAEEFIEDVSRFSNLSIQGLFTHFPLADTDPKFTRRQIQQMTDLVKRLKSKGCDIPYIHAANSAGFVGFNAEILNLARPGLMLYGLYPDKGLKNKIKLRPAMSVKARVIFTKQIPKGCGVSYGHLYVAPRNIKVAVISIGYSDGYFRNLSNKSSVLINGEVCSLLGRVTMDQIVVDVTKLKSVRLGQEVVVLGQQMGKEISADELAQKAGTINYEIVCNLGNRLPRVYK